MIFFIYQILKLMNHIPYMKNKVLDSLINEDYFGIIPSKIKAIKKSVKKIKDEKEKNDKKSVGNKIKNWFTSGFNNSGKNNKYKM